MEGIDLVIGLFVIGIVGWGITKQGGIGTMYSTYTNRYGRVCYLLTDLLTKFYAMQSALNNQGIDIDMTQGWRGQAEQEQDFAKGVSHAHWGQSAHNYAAAFDVVPFDSNGANYNMPQDIWDAIGQAGTDQGLTWGGTFTTILDKPHFEEQGWKEMALLPNQPEVG